MNATDTSGEAPRTGVLVLNVGTPDAPEPAAVRRYLRQFLSDPRVIDVNAVGRWLLLNLIILPFRPKRSAAAYAKVWTPDGSPLLVHSDSFRARLQDALGDAFVVALGMTYGAPSIASALERFERAGVDRVVLFPQFPQHAAATTGSALGAVYRETSERWNMPSFSTVPPFYDDDGFIRALGAVGRPVLDDVRPDHVLFSFHGLPERHVRKSDPTSAHCLQRSDCCASIGPANRHCYRAQCHATARRLATTLDLSPDDWSLSFQSRLGRARWLHPYTARTVKRLARAGSRRLVVFTPAFTVDCLETLEEIGMGARDIFCGAGGEEFQVVPCLNAHSAWVESAARLVRATAFGPA